MELTARWTTIAASQSPWEPDALDYERLLDAEPTRAWSTAVCVSVDDRLNHVDLIVLTVKGYFLVKVKSRAGDVTGDQQRFDWKDEAYQFEFDNRLRLVNLKSKRPNALLASERVLRSARLERASKTLRQAVNSALGTLERMKRVESRDEGRRRLVAEVVYRLPAQPWVQARPSLARDLDDVPLSELAAAILLEGGKAPQQGEPDLETILKSIARRYGALRFRDQSRARLSAAAELAFDVERCASIGGLQ